MELMISHGVRCAKAHIRLPIVIPLVAQGPTEVGPYGDLIRLGQTMLDEDVLNVTILSGFGAIASRVVRDSLVPHAAPVTEIPSRGARQTSPTPGRTA